MGSSVDKEGRRIDGAVGILAQLAPARPTGGEKNQ